MTTQKNVKWDDATPEEQILRATKLVSTLEGLTLHEQRKHFNMSDWLFKTECGTVGCAAGHCGIKSWFRNRGFKIDLVQDKTGEGVPIRGMFSSDFPELQSEEFFGDDIENNIFTNRRFTRQDGGRAVYKQVLNAARLYVAKLTAELASVKLQEAADKAQVVADEAHALTNAAISEFQIATYYFGV